MNNHRLLTLGDTDIKVSALGLGTVKFGRNRGVKYPAAFDLPSDSDISELLANAQALGINLLDTAPAYGSSEERIGKVIDRSDWVLSTKVGEEFDGSTSRFDFSAKHTIHSVHRSLRRLKTDFIDIVLVHSDGNDLEIIEQSDCLSALADLKHQGLIRGFGMSTKSVEGGLRALSLCDILMVTYNPQERADGVVIEEAAKNDKGIFIKKAFNSGTALSTGSSADVGTSAATMEFIFSTPGVSSVITGTLNSGHLEENYRAVASARRGTGTLA